jgi:hypothetical protein
MRARRWLLLAALCSAGAPFVRRAAQLLPLHTAPRTLPLPAAWPTCAAAPPAPPLPPAPPAPSGGDGASAAADAAFDAWCAAAAPLAPFPLRLALVSTYTPTHCGLATFSAALRRGILAGGGARVAAVDVVAVHTGAPGSATPAYPPEARASLLLRHTALRAC